MPKFIFKANDLVLSHCQCSDEPAMSTGQMDCPWCGCGWMIPCSKCARAFVFAEIREIATPLTVVGRHEAERRGLNDTPNSEVEAWATAMAEALEPFSVGQTVVYLDGEYWPIDARDVSFDGYFAHHHLPTLPHADALVRPEALIDVLGDPKYWRDRELPDRE